MITGPACITMPSVPGIWYCTGTQKARMVEVKGPTDSLSQQQRAWLKLMSDSGMDAYVAKVLPPGSVEVSRKG